MTNRTTPAPSHRHHAGYRLRIGEAAAIVWDAIDLDAATVEVRGTVVRVKGVGLVIQPRPKSSSGFRTLDLSRWAVDMLKRRRATWKPNEWGSFSPRPTTVATLMDEAGLTARAAADQLGHAQVTMTQNFYFGRKVAKTGAAVLEVIDGKQPKRAPRKRVGKGGRRS